MGQKSIKVLFQATSMHTHEIFKNSSILKLWYILKNYSTLFAYQVQNKNKALYMKEQVHNYQITLDYSLRSNNEPIC